jgi:D-arabinose 1-dehydrogenase-like Zn-dependent alcohol dehydrogenase
MSCRAANVILATASHGKANEAFAKVMQNTIRFRAVLDMAS